LAAAFFVSLQGMASPDDPLETQSIEQARVLLGTMLGFTKGKRRIEGHAALELQKMIARCAELLEVRQGG
jgi:hypothetical protein